MNLDHKLMAIIGILFLLICIAAGDLIFRTFRDYKKESVFTSPRLAVSSTPKIVGNGTEPTTSPSDSAYYLSVSDGEVHEELARISPDGKTLTIYLDKIETIQIRR